MACINTDRWTWMGSEIMPELGLSPGHQSATVEMKVDGPQKCVRLTVDRKLLDKSCDTSYTQYCIISYGGPPGGIGASIVTATYQSGRTKV